MVTKIFLPRSDKRVKSYLNNIQMTLRTLRASSTYSSLLFESLTITFIEIMFCICSPNPTTNFETKNLKFLQKNCIQFFVHQIAVDKNKQINQGDL